MTYEVKKNYGEIRMCDWDESSKYLNTINLLLKYPGIDLF